MPVISTNGINLHYQECGSGEPVLLIMGITAPGSVWEKHAEVWSETFRCILPDNRGVGRSDQPTGPYSSAQMAEDFIGLLDALGLQQVRVVGCSMGSIIAQQLALRHPQRVRSLVLMCPWARCDAYARGIFEHLIAIKAHLRPEEFMTYIQLLIFSKPTWDDANGFAGLLDGRRQAGGQQRGQAGEQEGRDADDQHVLGPDAARQLVDERDLGVDQRHAQQR